MFFFLKRKWKMENEEGGGEGGEGGREVGKRERDREK